MLERQMKVVVGAQLPLQQINDFGPLLVGQAGNGELSHGRRVPDDRSE
jgi:hypothetical protein